MKSLMPSSVYRKESELVKLITLYLPEPYIRALDLLVNERFYPNRAEAIRVAIRDLISTEVWEKKPIGD
jgi:Arc/MetJ-type ribon-helix-helix transcriptional regulator